MWKVTLSVVGVGVFLAAGAMAQDSFVTLAAPMGEPIRQAAPGMNLYFGADRPRSHSASLAELSVTSTVKGGCDEAFLAAVRGLAAQARAQGANGIIDIRSPQGDVQRGAPRYVCNRASNQVSLTGSAVQLTGSSAPPPATARRIYPGTPSAAQPPTYPHAIAMPYSEGLHAQASEVAFMGRPQPVAAAFPREFGSVSAVGQGSGCEDAFVKAANGLVVEAQRKGADVVERAQSAGTSGQEVYTRYVCIRPGPESVFIVTLTGYARGRGAL